MKIVQWRLSMMGKLIDWLFDIQRKERPMHITKKQRSRGKEVELSDPKQKVVLPPDETPTEVDAPKRKVVGERKQYESYVDDY
jgi:hypothetical protein